MKALYKLYTVPNRTWVRLPESGEHIFYEHVDGMYSSCKKADGTSIHLAAWTEVEIDDNQGEDKAS